MSENDIDSGAPSTEDSGVRKIIHCDCDCFYASVEMRDNPALREQPLVVGGRADQRGVVAACNYVARRFGIHSAMPTGQALRLCPDLIVIPPAMEKYRIASQQILAIYHAYTDLVEPLSLDEAYLDVSLGCQHSSATQLAQEIRARIEGEIGITASAGIAPNKFIAKIASDWNKPNGQFVVKPQQVDAFVAALPVNKLFGVGRVTAAHLQRLGVNTCGDLRTWARLQLQHEFGKFGGRLFELCRGIDARPVQPNRIRKSVSVEETYVLDLPDLTSCQDQLPELLTQLQARLERKAGAPPLHKLFIKIRFADFQKTSAECLATEINSSLFAQLLATAFGRGQRPVRLLGVGVRLAPSETDPQLGLFGT